MLGNVECPIQQINSNDVQCTVPSNSAGNFAVSLQSDTGNSNNDVLFQYNLQISSLSSTQGKKKMN